MNDTQLESIRSSFKGLSQHGDELAERFFVRLFAAQPMLKALFPREAWQRDRDALSGLGMAVKNLHRLEAIQYLLEEAGARCTRVGAQPHHFGVARDAMVNAMREVATQPDFSGPQWSEEIESDWTEALNVVVSMMIRGAGRSRARAA